MFIRAITALCGLLIIGTIWHFFETQGMVALFSLITLISTIEFSSMVEKESRIIRSLFVALSYAFFLSFTFLSQSFLIFLICFILMTSYFILFSQHDNQTKSEKLNSWIMGFIYCGALTGTATHGLMSYGISFVFAIFLLSFGTDTFAYLGGRLLGRRKLAPQISPNKTIEGSLSGLIFGTAAGTYYLSSIDNSSPFILILLCCLLSSIFTQVGDLFESLIKRNSGVKDSGKMMPGHGGVLDRIDGLLFAGPTLYMWMMFYLN